MTLPKIILNHLKKSRLNHAYLFYGPGQKYKTALKFAGIILSSPLKKLINHPDFIILEKEDEDKEIKIGRVREIIKKISLCSYGARVVLIRRAELLSPEAANALLKTLEEPPQRTIFLLTAPNPKEVITTIVSRCQGYYLPPEKDFIKDNLVREKASRFLEGSLIERFQLAKEAAGKKGEEIDFIKALEDILRQKFFQEPDLRQKKKLAADLKKINGLRLLLKRNISARLILEELALRMSK